MHTDVSTANRTTISTEEIVPAIVKFPKSTVKPRLLLTSFALKYLYKTYHYYYPVKFHPQ